jgi:hypothetical protein
MSAKQDFKKATMAYIQNKEIIKSQFSGELYSLELEKNELNDIFDKCASTDILYKAKSGLIYGVAMRVNFTPKYHKSVTIRYKRWTGTKTEYQKTIDAIKNNSINSAVGIQIDVDEKLCIKSGIIYDRYGLYTKIENEKESFLSQNLRTCYEGNKFFYITYPEFNSLEIKHKLFQS